MAINRNKEIQQKQTIYKAGNNWQDNNFSPEIKQEPKQESKPEEKKEIKQPETIKKAGRPKNPERIHDFNNSQQKGLKTDQRRLTIVLNLKYYDALREYADKNRLSMINTIDDIFKEFFNNHKGYIK